MPLVLVLSFLACAGRAEAEEVASVMLVDGQATVREADGSTAPAVVGLALDRTDTIVTAEESVVVLHLKNEHLVRVDEDLELPVARIVLLGAPAATLDARAQLAQLLYPEERTSIPGLAQAERVAGWHARLTAAQAPGAAPEAEEAPADEAPAAKSAAADTGAMDEAPPQPAKPRAPAPKTSARAPAASRSAAPPPPPPEPAAQPPASTTAAPGAAASGGGGAPMPAPGAAASGGAPMVAPPAEGAAAPAERERDPKPSEAPGRADLQARFATDLKACVATWSATLPVRVETLDVTVRLAGDRVERVVFSGGLMPPACVRDALTGAVVSDVPAPSFTFQVALP